MYAKFGHQKMLKIVKVTMFFIQFSNISKIEKGIIEPEKVNNY